MYDTIQKMHFFTMKYYLLFIQKSYALIVFSLLLSGNYVSIVICFVAYLFSWLFLLYYNRMSIYVMMVIWQNIMIVSPKIGVFEC